MLNRLVELLYRAHHNASCVMNEGGSEDEMLEEEARYLLKYGVIVPPCKVGDTVYIYGGYFEGDKIHPFQITNLLITQNKKGVWTKKYRAMWLKNGKTVDAQHNFAFEDIGKTVFLTREEAERALRGEHGGQT